MREIVSLQIGQCGNQIGAKVCTLINASRCGHNLTSTYETKMGQRLSA